MTPFFSILIFVVSIIFLLRWRTRPSSKRLPPGSLGLPIIGHSLPLLRAMRANVVDAWLEERVQKYGPISKLTLFGKPTVFIPGAAANKFIFMSDGTTLSNAQPQSLRRVLGDRNITELSGGDHKRVRNALLSFMKPESLKRYMKKMDMEVKEHFHSHWHGKDRVTVWPTMKSLTFDIISSLLLGLERGPDREKFKALFKEVIIGLWSIPINLPLTRYSRSIRSSERAQDMVKALIQDRRAKIEKNEVSPQQDLITCLLNDKEVISDKEIIHNVMLAMVAGYDTSSTLLTFLVRNLANDLSVYKAVLQEQEEITKGKSSNEHLTWEDLAKMKYTWRVAQETLRMIPPTFGGFRKTLKDIEYGGYSIPKGWQIFWVTSMTHMDNSIFTEASEFKPSRFENQASIPPYNYIPFGAGARICPGYELARIETLVSIHYLITRFEWKLCHTDNMFSRDPTPIPTQGLPIQILPRKLSPSCE